MIDYLLVERRLAGTGGADIYDAGTEEQVEALAYTLCRRTQDGMLSASTPITPRDHILLGNMRAEATRPKSKGSGDPDLASFNALISKE